MKTFKTLGLAILLSGTASLVMAQGMDHSNMEGMSTPPMNAAPGADVSSNLPDICLGRSSQPAGMPMEMDIDEMMGGMSDGHRAMMANMNQMHNEMMMAMMADDFDVAFICGMIPHHRGALDMANAALEHAEDEWVKDIAQKIVAAQEREIAEMLEWLEAR